jgi:hypothetical protein
LDVGCDFGGLGNYLQLYSKMDYTLAGFDFPGFDKEELTKRGYTEIFEGTHISVVQKRFDVIVCNQVCEHLFPEELPSWLVHMKSIANTIIVSVPFPWHTFAWNLSYLKSSRKLNVDIDSRLFDKIVGAVHKSIVSSKLMLHYGYKVHSINESSKSFFYLANNTKVDYALESSRYYRSIYERVIVDTLRSEPYRYKLTRKIIDYVSRVILYLCKRFRT